MNIEQVIYKYKSSDQPLPRPQKSFTRAAYFSGLSATVHWVTLLLCADSGGLARRSTGPWLVGPPLNPGKRPPFFADKGHLLVWNRGIPTSFSLNHTLIFQITVNHTSWYERGHGWFHGPFDRFSKLKFNGISTRNIHLRSGTVDCLLQR